MVTVLDKQTALVLIDLQKGVVNLPLAHPVENVISNAVKLTNAFHKAGLPVVIVNVDSTNAAWTKTRKDAKPVNRSMSEDWTQIIPQIQQQLGDILITKHTWGAFHETGLHHTLQQRHITGIVLAGIATSIGVESTARQASELAYNIAFAQDAMTDMFAEAHEKSVQYIFPRIGELDHTDAIIEKLQGRE
ncbi:MAG: isochorismatase family protein [Bacteroidota bacterium]|nr:isochorismatase family protein [Bacteroidota bacterium]